ncbi:class I SAM-dependent methyltransferase [Pseudolysobacter antarcticus]|uniref:Class I SAM-dependent methyltransferase n=2 Tax=Pseudolysobacter antarcticus TaxID=2511995 RepID=A0A411HPX2_9GAMM|nr:class I SAM-dependent methyltransferase [Pseudolysobacter antarcticus]
MIEHALPDRAAAIIDIGGGQSTLVDDLLERNYSDVSVLDISRAAIEGTRARLGGVADRARWHVADITHEDLPTQRYDLWHDRAVFHFLTTAAGRAAYFRQLGQALRPRGNVIIATFAPEGPAKCSGLNVVRYDAKSLLTVFGNRFELIGSTTHVHETPFGTQQPFNYCHFTMR